MRQLLKHNGIQDTLGITDDEAARFGIAQALVRHPTDKTFSSHGRPYPQENGVVRWLKQDGSGDTPLWYAIQDQRLIEYNELQDEYKKLTELPHETGLEGGITLEHGRHISTESFTVPDMTPDAEIYENYITGIDIANNRIYLLERTGGLSTRRLHVFHRDGTYITSESGGLDYTGHTNISGTARTGGTRALAVHDGKFYTGFYYGTGPDNNSRRWQLYIHVFDIATRTYESRFNTGIVVQRRYLDLDSYYVDALSVTEDYIYMLRGSGIRVFDHAGDRQTSQENISGTGKTTMAIDGNIAYLGNSLGTDAYTLDGTAVDENDFLYGDIVGGPVVLDVDANNGRYYLLSGDGGNRVSTLYIDVFSLGEPLDFGRFVPYQFDTADNDAFYLLATNSVQGNAIIRICT